MSASTKKEISLDEILGWFKELGREKKLYVVMKLIAELDNDTRTALVNSLAGIKVDIGDLTIKDIEALTMLLVRVGMAFNKIQMAVRKVAPYLSTSRMTPEMMLIQQFLKSKHGGTIPSDEEIELSEEEEEEIRKALSKLRRMK